jgi:hypothetical protein
LDGHIYKHDHTWLNWPQKIRTWDILRSFKLDWRVRCSAKTNYFWALVLAKKNWGQQATIGILTKNNEEMTYELTTGGTSNKDNGLFNWRVPCWSLRLLTHPSFEFYWIPGHTSFQQRHHKQNNSNIFKAEALGPLKNHYGGMAHHSGMIFPSCAAALLLLHEDALE